MKKKKWRIFGVVVLLLLIIPIPTGMYKDGGTREYTALTYKIVKWKHLYGTGNIYSRTKVYPFPMNFLSIDSLWYREEKNLKIDENQAIGLAKQRCTVDFNEVKASFDFDKGSWTVNFYSKNTAGGNQTVAMDATGSIIHIIYGE